MSHSFEEIYNRLPDVDKTDMVARVSLIQEKNPDHTEEMIKTSVAKEFEGLAYPAI